MALPLPANTTYGFVTGRVITAVADTLDDPDIYPESVPATGTVTFTPKVDFVRNTVNKTLMVPRPVVTYLDGEGHMTLGDGITQFGGDRTIALVASDSPGIIPSGWSYTVSFELAGANGVALPVPSFDITLLSGVSVDLADLAPSESAPILSVANATALAAQAAASAAAAQAAAEAATGGGGTGTDNNAMHFRGAWEQPGISWRYLYFEDGTIPAGFDFMGNPWTVVDKTDTSMGYTKALKSPTLAENTGAALRVDFGGRCRVDDPITIWAWVSTEPDVGKFYPNSAPMRSGTTDTESVASQFTYLEDATTVDLYLAKGTSNGVDAGDDAVYIYEIDVPVKPVPQFEQFDVVTYGGGVFMRTVPASTGDQSVAPVAGSTWLQLA